MAGHSKWANTRHRKGAVDAKRNKLFTKIVKEIIVAVQTGGSGDISSNPRLRTAVLKARVANMPKDNIEKAIKKGLGATEGVNYTEILYEGYAPNGVALLIDVLTDNKNRSISDVKSTLTKNGGALGTSGSVSYLFNHVGLIYLESNEPEDTIIEIALEAGAEDVEKDENVFQISTTPSQFSSVLEIVESKGWKILEAKIARVPQTEVSLQNTESIKKILSLIDKLEDLEDVQSVQHNLQLSEQLRDELENC